MPKASELTPETRFVALFVGRAGSGKTCAMASFPKPMEIMDFDGRIRGLLGAPWLNRDGIIYEPFPPKEKDLIERINKKMDTMVAMGNVNQLSLKTFTLDSLTSETFALVQQALPITHAGGKGMSFGPIQLTGPEDYKFESQGTQAILATMRSLPISNIIVSAHIIPRWGKVDPSNKFSENVEVGEKLSITDKLGENVQIYFDHVFRFERRLVGNSVRYFVVFRSDLARTAYADLPDGEVDITGKNFYDVLMSYVKKEKVV